MFGTAELGYYFYCEHQVVKGVRDGARFARGRASSMSTAWRTALRQPFPRSCETAIKEVTRTGKISGGTVRDSGLGQCRCHGDSDLPWNRRSPPAFTRGPTNAPQVNIDRPVSLIRPLLGGLGLLDFTGYHLNAKQQVGGDGDMSALRFPSPLMGDQRGSVAEFALVLPLAMLFMLGTIDAGRYLYEVNQLEKATQMGARFAVVTNPVAQELTAESYVGRLVA